jgi:hypothetical protein
MSNEKRIIDSSELLDVFEFLIGDKPDGYGYGDVFEAVKGEKWYGNTCQNWSYPKGVPVEDGGDQFYDGERIPMCIIGQAFGKLGVLKHVGRYESWSGAVEQLAKENIFFTDDALLIMRMAQSLQDVGASWSVAVFAARVATMNIRSIEIAKTSAGYEK